MKQRASTPKPTSHLFKTIALASIFFVIGYVVHAKHEMKFGDDRVLFVKAINRLSDTSYAFPKSNIEWFTANIAMTPKQYVKSSTIATTVAGKVTNKSVESGTLPTISKHYYVGSPGTYDYDSALTIAVGAESRTFYFSPNRTELMRVVSVRNGRQTPATFESIAVGDMVEVEETVELTKSNINDENLLSLTVRIIK